MAQMKEDSPQVVVEDAGAVQADLSPQDPCVKCVRFSGDLKLLLSGGADGYVRVWEVSVSHESVRFVSAPSLSQLVSSLSSSPL